MDNPLEEQNNLNNSGNSISKSSLIKVAALCSFFGALFGALLGYSLNGIIFDKTKYDIIDYQQKTKSKLSSVKGNNLFSREEPIVKIVNAMKPSVVNIGIKKSFEHNPPLNIPNKEKLEGIGSGIILNKDGLIITNTHVIEDAKDVIITLSNGKDYKAKIVNSDRETDIAILKINAKNLKPAIVGSSKDLRVGSLVVAIGSPWQLEHTVTAGIVSAKNRKVDASSETGQRFYPNLIQTDAAVNPGNSGGALLDKDGKLVGINTLIYSESGKFEGVSFAIPVENALNAAKQLISRGKVSHSYIGVLGQDISEEIAKKNNASNLKGAVMVDVVADSPAGKAGLKIGDIVTNVNNFNIENMSDMIAAIRAYKVGQVVRIHYIRNKVRKTISVKIAEKPQKY